MELNCASGPFQFALLSVATKVEQQCESMRSLSMDDQIGGIDNVDLQAHCRNVASIFGRTSSAPSVSVDIDKKHTENIKEHSVSIQPDHQSSLPIVCLVFSVLVVELCKFTIRFLYVFAWFHSKHGMVMQLGGMARSRRSVQQHLL